MIKKIKLSSFWEGQNIPHYFHPSICSCNDGLLMTMQTYEGISDTFGPVLWSLSKDTGNSWSEPQAIQAFKHNKLPNGLLEGIADVRTVFHHHSKGVIAIGCNAYYGMNGHWQYGANFNGKVLPQFPVYAVRRADGCWSERKELKVDFFKHCLNWRVACAQILVLPDGNVLIPIYFSKKTKSDLFSVCSMRCSFGDGKLVVKDVSNILSSDVNRGLIEPSLAVLNDKYYMTIRAEDDQGYFSVSDDGLKWGEIIPWCWDDGEPLIMSSTQQHWVCNGKSLFLVYMRKTCFNNDALRWRAPLFIARFDEKHACLVKETEKEVLPLIRTNGTTNSMGNFHAVDISSTKSIVSVGSVTHWFKNDKIHNFFSDIKLAKIYWK